MDSIPHENNAGKPQKHRPASTSELMASAKLVAEAAQSTMRHESGKVDKGRVAGAAADLLGAASHYGKLEGKGVGKYVEKAETYLHSYNVSHSSVPGGVPNQHPNSTTTDHDHDHDHSKPQTHDHSSGSGSGYGDYFKMAEGFLKKH